MDGGTITAGQQRYSSDLTQGGLEIPYDVKCRLPVLILRVKL